MGLHPVASEAHTVPAKLDVGQQTIDGSDTEAGTEAGAGEQAGLPPTRELNPPASVPLIHGRTLAQHEHPEALAD